nr:type II toxin-antitoxin system HicB family antitoxin [uncultured Blautia sp.]
MKREITYYMEEYYPVKIVEDTEEGGFTISLPDCPGCITCCQHWEDIPATIADAQKAWLETVTENVTPPVEERQEKDLDYYMGLFYNIDVVSRDESGYTVGIRELPWITATNESMDTALELLDCNKDSWLEEAVKSGVPIPEPPRDDRYDLPEEIADAIDRGNSLLAEAEKNAKWIKEFFYTMIVSSNDTDHSIGMDLRHRVYRATRIPKGKYTEYNKEEIQELYREIIEEAE